MASDAAIQRTTIESDIAVLTIDVPDKSANILSLSVLDELDAAFSQLESDSSIGGLIIASAKPGIFIAGADIREFVASLDAPAEQTIAMCQRGQQLFARLSKMPFPTVAAIEGICVGGGAELAIWCDRRVLSASDKTQFGFPEVKLGLIPGWGGTVRTPRIVGLSNAVEMITSGESISGAEAVGMGLASNCVPTDKLMAAAVNQIRLEQSSREYESDREEWNAPIASNHSELGFLGATASSVIQGKTKGHYPAPSIALEAILEASMVPADMALEHEAMAMSQLFGTPINAALINVFFLNDRVKRDLGVEDKSLTPAKIGRVGLIGAGIMGAGIAAANLKRGCEILLTDTSAEAMARGAESILDEVAYNKATKKKDLDRMRNFSTRLNTVPKAGDLTECDLVIEAVVENPKVKKTLFAAIEPDLPPESILASNTSTIPISTLAEGMNHPERFCGIHFFNPVRKMQLVEVIRGEKTNDQTVATAVAHCKRIGKLPIVVEDGPGFLVNRILLPYMNEALVLLCEGAELAAIEKAARTFGMPMGPFTLYDVVGMDTALFAGRTMEAAFPDRVQSSPLLGSLVEAGRLGQKSGAGFFQYSGPKKKKTPDPGLAEFVGQHAIEREPPDAEEITDRLFLTMLIEATRILDEKIVRNVRDIDFGLIFGIGFPPFKGGLMFWADTVGVSAIVDRLEPLSSLGPRLVPTKLLTDLADSGGKLYDL